MERNEVISRIRNFAGAKNHRKVSGIVIHCSANPEGQDIGAAEIKRIHVKERGWADIGYHFVIRIDGTIEAGRPLQKAGAHVSGHNANTIGICYVGGYEKDKVLNPRTGKKEFQIKDTRTPAQKESLRWLLQQLVEALPTVTRICGHRDYSPDLNGNGVIETFEFIKGCPCFDAIPEYRDLLPL